MKLFTRYNRINVLCMVAVFLLSSIVYYFLLKYVLIHELDETLFEKKHLIEQYVRVHNKLPSLQDADEMIITCTPSTSYTTPTGIVQLALPDPEDGKLHDFRQLTYSQQAGPILYTVQIAKAVEGTRVLLRVIAGITVVTILLIILLSIVLNRILLQKLWRPFYDTIAALHLFKISHSSRLTLPDTDIDEFRFLQENLSLAMENAHKEYHLLKEFTENASHEFQTPLAIIRSRLDLLIQEENLSDGQTELLKHTYSAITRLSRLNQSLLLLTKIENNQFPEIESLNLREKLEEKIRQLQELWNGMDLQVSAHLEDTHASVNPALLDILLNNLLSNASKHNVKNGSIHIRLQNRSLIIENTAQGNMLDSERLFKRFYKEAPQSNSNGLGLSIVNEICHQLHIKIEYSFTDQQHNFTLIFP